jgi:hypothetical protein
VFCNSFKFKKCFFLNNSLEFQFDANTSRKAYLHWPSVIGDNGSKSDSGYPYLGSLVSAAIHRIKVEPLQEQRQVEMLQLVIQVSNDILPLAIKV